MHEGHLIANEVYSEEPLCIIYVKFYPTVLLFGR